MPTMIEKIRELPLFKGISPESIQLILEKLPLHFHNAEAGETVIRKGEQIEVLSFVISGSLKVEGEIERGRITVCQWVGEGCMLFPDFLFGYERRAPMSVVAAEKCGLLCVSKQLLVELISADRYCLVNLLNDLSYKAQARLQFGEDAADNEPLARLLRHILVNLTYRRARRIEIVAKDYDLQAILGIGPGELAESLERLRREKKIEYYGDVISINCRKEYF